MRRTSHGRGWFSGGLGCVLVSLLVVLLLPWYLWLIACWISRAIWLPAQWVWTHGGHGKRFLVLYSDSPKWKECFETQIIPLLGDSAVVVNITTDIRWKSARSFERRAHRQWGCGERPIVIHFPPFWFARTVFFRHAFDARWHQNDETLLSAQLAELRSLMSDDADRSLG